MANLLDNFCRGILRPFLDELGFRSQSNETGHDRQCRATGKSLSEALLFAKHGENMLCTKFVLNVRNNFCTQDVLPRFKHGIFMY